jgi:hypothetical protein
MVFKTFERNHLLGRVKMSRWILALLVCGSLLATACCTGECNKCNKGEPKDEPKITKTGTADMTHAVTYDVNYYMSGPQQARPPEGSFKAGTKVQLIQDAGSYSLVCSEDGIQAYISSDAIKALK